MWISWLDDSSLSAVVGCDMCATCWHVGGLSCSVSEDASHNHDSNELAIMLPMPHSLCQGSSGFLMRSLSRYVMTDPLRYTCFLQKTNVGCQLLLLRPKVSPKQVVFWFFATQCAAVHGRHKCSYDVQVRSLIFNSVAPAIWSGVERVYGSDNLRVGRAQRMHRLSTIESVFNGGLFVCNIALRKELKGK